MFGVILLHDPFSVNPSREAGRKKYSIFFEKGLAFFGTMWYYTLALRKQMYAAVAQLDRVTDYESVGRGFESLSPYQERVVPFGMTRFCIKKRF